jgi:hypothetical protein
MLPKPEIPGAADQIQRPRADPLESVLSISGERRVKPVEKPSWRFANSIGTTAP